MAHTPYVLYGLPNGCQFALTVLIRKPVPTKTGKENIFFLHSESGGLYSETQWSTHMLIELTE